MAWIVTRPCGPPPVIAPPEVNRAAGGPSSMWRWSLRRTPDGSAGQKMCMASTRPLSTGRSPARLRRLWETCNTTATGSAPASRATCRPRKSATSACATEPTAGAKSARLIGRGGNSQASHHRRTVVSRCALGWGCSAAQLQCLGPDSKAGRDKLRETTFRIITKSFVCARRLFLLRKYKGLRPESILLRG